MTTDSLYWPVVEAYLEHAAEGRLVVPECRDCGETHFPPRTLCPYCLSSALDLRESAGEGTIHSFSVVHLDYHPTWGDAAPYVNALVALDDGPVVFANLVGCDPGSLAVGDTVTVTFEDVDGRVLPMFTPV